MNIYGIILMVVSAIALVNIGVLIGMFLVKRLVLKCINDIKDKLRFNDSDMFKSLEHLYYRIYFNRF